ncbi:HIT-like protein [Periconia macrospinosa]|uniref:HIT-like protein n=1 Tax=Periconia macrospinosa TaxID=97972 RepID=A0A2V1E5N3_9PLEO|nr:HIT-like protein [Periconia macrospinosa]
MPPLIRDVVKFSDFVVTTHVFHTSPLSFAFVNLKPLLPGHVLVSPHRVVPRFSNLSTAEVQDLFLTVQRVSRTIERVYHASALNIAIQDGRDSGQSVPHVHVHIIPRKKDDLPEDAIYPMLDSEDGDVARQLRERKDATEKGKKSEFPPDEERKARSDEEMEKEAKWLAEEIDKDTES